jgi:hypothetical protein
LDTAAALLAIQNENDNSAVTAMMRRLRRIAADYECSILLLHHTPKMTRDLGAKQAGEATLVRGGGAWVNSARVVLSITSLSAKECRSFAVANPNRIRRIQHVKINDQLHMQPELIELKSVGVTINDGSQVSVRAIQFLNSGTSLQTASDPIRSLAMEIVDAGTTDKHGTVVPLSPPGSGGNGNQRGSVDHVARGLLSRGHCQTIEDAKSMAWEILDELISELGYISCEEVVLSKYKPSGGLDGSRKSNGLVCHWDLAPWPRMPPEGPAPQGPAAQRTSPDPGRTAPSSPPPRGADPALSPEAAVTPAQPEAAVQGSRGIPFMITPHMKEVLRRLGYSAADITHLTPQQAFDIIHGRPGPPSGFASTEAASPAEAS